MFQRARLMLTAAYAAALGLTLTGVAIVSYLLIQDDLNAEMNESLRAATRQLDAQAAVASTPEAVPDPVASEDSGDDDDDDKSGKNDDDDDEDKSGKDESDDDSGKDGDDSYDDDVALLAVIPSDVFYVSFDPAGVILANPRAVGLGGVDLAHLAGELDHEPFHEIRGDDSNYRMLVTPLEDGNFLAVGRSLRLAEHQLATIRNVFAVGGVIGFGVSLVTGFWLAGRTLGPIRRSLESQRQFVSDASHELRTPLTVAKANNAALLEDPEATIESRLDEAEAVALELDHLAVLVGDLTTLARADEGRANLLLEPLDFGALVDEVVRDMGALADVLHVQLACDVQAVTVRGDRARLRQLVVILVDNSLKYASEGGHVQVRCSTDGSRAAELSVTDDGAGISPEDQKRIFERFYRADAERTRSKGGTGLGLAIGKWIAEAHGGRIAVESQPGAGTTFRVRLPL